MSSVWDQVFRTSSGETLHGDVFSLSDKANLRYISGSIAKQGSVIVSANVLGITNKIEKIANLIPIPKDRFDDPKYYRS